MFVVLAAIFAVLIAASAFPHRRRTLSRVCLVWFLGVIPVVLLIYAIARWDGSHVGSYLGLIPGIVAVLCVIDAKHGLSHRMARIRRHDEPRERPRTIRPGQRASE